MKFIQTLSQYLLFAALSTSVLAQTPLSWETTNHVRVLFYQTQSVPMLTLHLAFKAGSAYDNNAYGLSALTSSMLDQGNAGFDANQIADQMAETGAVFSANANREMSTVSLSTLTEPTAFKEAVAVFKRILFHPDFPLPAFNQQKNLQLATLRNEQESPDTVAINTFFNTLYQHHPYGHAIHGTPNTVPKIQRQEVIDFYHRYFVAENAVMVMVGAIDPAQAKQLAETILAELPSGKKAPPLPEAKPYTGTNLIQVPFSATQTTLCLGQLGITHHSPTYFPLLVGNYILGGGSLTSRLALEVREKNGLTYGVNSEFLPMPSTGPFLISLSTQNAQAPKALRLTEEVTDAFIQSGPTATELTAAKAYLTGSFPLSLASNTDIANMLVKIAFYELPLDFLETYVARINAVTIEEIKQAFLSTLSMKKMLTVSVGPE